MTGDDTPRLRIILGDNPRNEAVVDFVKKLQTLQQDATELRSDAARAEVPLFGLVRRSDLPKLTRRHADLLDSVTELREATEEGELTPVDGGANDPSANSEFRGYLADGQIWSTLDRVDKQLARTGRLLQNKREAATARLGLVISLLAVGASAAAVIV
jgi:hypothetical protein